MRMHETFLLQNKWQVGQVCQTRCVAVDLATFYRKINAG